MHCRFGFNEQFQIDCQVPEKKRSIEIAGLATVSLYRRYYGTKASREFRNDRIGEFGERFRSEGTCGNAATALPRKLGRRIPALSPSGRLPAWTLDRAVDRRGAVTCSDGPAKPGKIIAKTPNYENP